ncbi:MAG: triose-phosphate isomerase [Candidatus Pacebacteria bacterium]|nr:triose-phosphate isomerase [Candidatus Paceibacterota bacterium]
MLIVANWKAYVESEKKAQQLFATAKRLAAKPDVQIVLAPPAPYLGLLAHNNKSKVSFGAQDVSRVEGGAATGEITPSALAELGVKYAIIGHSERRAMGETDEVVAEKVRNALSHKLTPILCVGERERDPNAKYLNFLRAELHAVFSILSPKERTRIIVAYEPIWAIGKSADQAITPNDLTEMVLYIRKVLGAYLVGRAADKAVLLYGGSVEARNAHDLLKDSGVNGLLVGRASVDSDSFSALVKAVS